MFGITFREEVVLLALYGDRLYGLQIQDIIASASRGEFEIKIGSLYPALHDLEEKGLVVSAWGEEDNAGARRRYYQLTADGEEALRKVAEFRKRLKKKARKVEE